MSDNHKKIIFPVFIVSFLGVCILGLLAMQFLSPVDTISKAPKADVSAWGKLGDVGEGGQQNQNSLEEPSLYTVSNLQKAFEMLQFSLGGNVATVDLVPRLYLEKFPSELSEIQQVQQRKDLFFKTLLPLVLKINEEIIATRSRLFTLLHRMKLGQRVTPQDTLWLETRFKRYGVKDGDVDALLIKIDRVPVSLALAQAAEESGWGTSRFVREGNALFGQWTFNPNDKGIVPDARKENLTHRIRAFASLSDSLRAYVFNLNSHPAYDKFRKRRAELRRNPTQLIGQRLASTLNKYSERGESYVQSLQALMRQNDLKQFDQVQLRPGQAINFQSLIEPPQAEQS